jgi:hypothetical protein
MAKSKSQSYRVRSLKQRMARLKQATIAVDVALGDFFDMRIAEVEEFQADLQKTLTVEPEKQDTVN